MVQQRKHMPAEERRVATVEAVIGLAAEQNPADITTGEIADRMGLTQGALFRHFTSKEAILQAAMAWVSERLLDRVDKAAAGASSAGEGLSAMFMAHIGFVEEHPGVPRMLFGELQRPGQTLPKKMAQTLIRLYNERLCRLLETGKAQGELRADLDVEAAATLFIGSVQGLVMQSMLAGDEARIRQQAPGVFAIYRSGIGAAA